MALITTATYRGARRDLLICCHRYRSYASREPDRRDHFIGWLKLKQRQLRQLRAFRRIPTLWSLTETRT